MENNYSLSDLAVATGNGWGNNGWGGNWGGTLGGGLIGYILGASTNGGGILGNGRNGCVTEADLCNANSFTELKNSVANVNNNQAAIARQTDNAICQLGYQALEQSSALGSKIDNCCCNTQLGIQGVKFDMANYASAIQMSEMQGTQKVLDKLCAMESAQKDAVIAQQGQRIAALEADARMCGVVRYPTASTYAVNCNPFFSGYSCGCANI